MLSDFGHFLLLLAPNVLNPGKLYKNLRHPIFEWVHTSHRMYPISSRQGEYLVEHYLFSTLVTLDKIAEPKTGKGEYYGHNGYFPNTFDLIDRVYVTESNRAEIEQLVGNSQPPEFKNRTFWVSAPKYVGASN